MLHGVHRQVLPPAHFALATLYTTTPMAEPPSPHMSLEHDPHCMPLGAMHHLRKIRSKLFKRSNKSGNQDISRLIPTRLPYDAAQRTKSSHHGERPLQKSDIHLVVDISPEAIREYNSTAWPRQPGDDDYDVITLAARQSSRPCLTILNPSIPNQSYQLPSKPPTTRAFPTSPVAVELTRFPTLPQNSFPVTPTEPLRGPRRRVQAVHQPKAAPRRPRDRANTAATYPRITHPGFLHPQRPNERTRRTSDYSSTPASLSMRSEPPNTLSPLTASVHSQSGSLVPRSQLILAPENRGATTRVTIDMTEPMRRRKASAPDTTTMQLPSRGPAELSAEYHRLRLMSSPKA